MAPLGFIYRTLLFTFWSLCVLSQLWGMDNVRWSSRAHWKARSGFLIIVFIELFFARCNGWGATNKNRSKIGDFANSTRAVWRKIAGRMDCPHQSFYTDSLGGASECLIARWQFLHKETLQHTFFKRSMILDGKRLFCVLSPLRGLRGNVRSLESA